MVRNIKIFATLLIFFVIACKHSPKTIPSEYVVLDKQLIKTPFQTFDTSEALFKKIVTRDIFGDTGNVYIVSGSVVLNIRYRKNKPYRVTVNNLLFKPKNQLSEFEGVSITYDSIGRLYDFGASYLSNEEVTVLRFDTTGIPYDIYIQRDTSALNSKRIKF
jgi:hypothetical protein